MNVLGLTPVIPIVFAFALPLTSIIAGGNRKVAGLYALTGTALTAVAAFKLFQLAYSSAEPLVYTFGGWAAPVGIVYEADRMSALLALVTAVLMLLIAVYSYRYLENEEGLEWYYTLYLGLEAGLLGVLLTGDAFNLFVMIEVTSIAAYALVMFYRDRGDSVVAGLKYAMIGAVGTTMYFLALGVFYYSFGTLNFANLSALVHGMAFPVVNRPWGNVVIASRVALALATWAFLIKAAVFPNHFWLPEAHPAAPSPISAVLSGLVVNVGVYALARFLYTVYGNPFGAFCNVVHALTFILIILGALSSFFGALMMLLQRDVKRLIAYSTVMHMGYLVMAIGVGTKLALTAALFHMVNHAIAKALLFLATGVFIHAAGSRDINDLRGIGREMPVAAFSLGVAGLSLVGVPPFNVFFSKLLLFNAFLNSSPALALVLVFSSVMALAAYVRLLYSVWFGEGAGNIRPLREGCMSWVCLLLAVACTVLGLAAPYIIGHYISPAAAQAFNYRLYVQAALKYAVRIKLL